MHIGILSDTHNDRRSGPLPKPKIDGEIDLMLAAGDIDVGDRGVEWLSESFPGIQVAYVLGNHEPAHGDLESTIAACKLAASKTDNVTVLECDELLLDHVDGGKLRVLGATLWTDFALYGNVPVDMNRNRVDFGATTYRGDIFTPEASAEVHKRSKAWLESKLSEEFYGTTIVMTHHAPTERCQRPEHIGGHRAPFFASNLDRFVEYSGAALWVCGHTHVNYDEMFGGTRLIARQEGYEGELASEFAEFEVQIIDLPSPYPSRKCIGGPP